MSKKSKDMEIQITINKSSLICFLLGGVISAVLLAALQLNLSLTLDRRWAALRQHVTERALLVPGMGLNQLAPRSNPLTKWALSVPVYSSEMQVLSGTSKTHLNNLITLQKKPDRYNSAVNISDSYILKGEALAALHQAIDAKKNGRKVKALKLFQHALALDPNHSDVLNEYGEFLEDEDIVKADHLYTCAVIFNGSHSKALSNLRRTSAAVAEIDKKMLDRIDEKHEQFLKISESSRVFERAREEFYYLQVYHTTAIEGNTLTLEQMRSIMETGLAVGGKSILEHNEVLGLELALQYINDTLMQRIGPITVKDILAIHQRVFGHVNPIDAGQMRTSQVFIGGHVPPPSTEIEDLMDDFVEWLNSEEALLLHPVEFAALAHYKLVYIHPFLDGNGRTARLLMNLILMRAGFPPVVVKLSERHTYYETIKMGNLGDLRPFIRFISNSLEDMLDAYIYLDSDMDHSITDVKESEVHVIAG